jgi:hypothetical protein
VVVKLFDGTFLAGTLLVVVAVVIALLAAAGRELPWIGVGRGALIAVAVVGVAGCAVGGIGQAPTIGWAHPVTIIGLLLGIAALAIIGAGLFGWSEVRQPVSGFIPGSTPSGLDETLRVALITLAGLMVLKWLVAVGLATYASLS